jgi:hypothetical protein
MKKHLSVRQVDFVCRPIQTVHRLDIIALRRIGKRWQSPNGTSNEEMSPCGADGIRLGPAANHNPMGRTTYKGVPDDGLST